MRSWGVLSGCLALMTVVGCGEDGNGADSCVSNVDCAEGQYCGAMGRCTFDCREDTDCAGGTCNSLGMCIGSTADAGVLDAGHIDAGRADGGPADASPPDGGGPDAPTDARTYDCNAPLFCPVPASGRITVCGRLRDVGTGADVRTASPDESVCPDTFAGGPCALKIDFYDTVAFTTGSALENDGVAIDTCGRFIAEGVQPPTVGSLALVVDDAEGAADDHVSTLVTLTGSAGSRVELVSAWATTRATDAAWTTSAGGPFGGATFGELGVVLGQFDDASGPVDGVTMTRSGSAQPDDDHYFGDGAGSRSTVEPSATATGANGAGLMLGSSLVVHSGMGAEATGCSWGSEVAAAVPGTIWMLELVLSDETGAPCSAP